MSESKQTIYQRISSVMLSVEALAKDRKNTQQNYSFRGIDDVYNDIHPLFCKNGIFSTSKILSEKSEERQSKSGGLLIYRVIHMAYTFFGIDGDSVTTEVIGEGMDSGDKASNKAMAVAHKYAIMQMLSIPTEDAKDPENDSPQPLPNPVNVPAATQPAPGKPPELKPASALPSGFSVADCKALCSHPNSGITFEDLMVWMKAQWPEETKPGTRPQTVVTAHAAEIKAYIEERILPF